MKNLIDLNEKCFIVSGSIFEANTETKPSIVSQYPKLWKKLPPKKSERYQEAVQQERKHYGTSPKENANFNEDDFMFKIGQRVKPVKDEKDVSIRKLRKQ
jgi:hypothetical protein